MHLLSLLQNYFLGDLCGTFFRLENEHWNNCGKFRAMRDISIAPIESSDQTQILRIMDDENGVLNRGKRKTGGKRQSNTGRKMSVA